MDDGGAGEGAAEGVGAEVVPEGAAAVGVEGRRVPAAAGGAAADGAVVDFGGVTAAICFFASATILSRVI